MQPLLASEPTQVGDYRFLARLSSGAMGVVYLARSKGGRVVAVKVVRSDLADDPEFRERFHREVAMARSVGGFWTAAVVDADPDAVQPWLATEYVPGPNLHRAVADHGTLPEHAVRCLGAGLAEALRAIHRAGLVHRDLKPANVLLGPDGPRVIDFGISRAMSSSALTATGAFLGTPGFFSPEQTLGNEVGPPSDVFSLGAVLVFAATGSGPFGNHNTVAMLYRAAHAEPDLSEVPHHLRPLLAACLAKAPHQRPTADELLNQLGGTAPQGAQWLPSDITAVIAEHTSRMQEAANAPLGSGPWTAPPAAAPSPAAPPPAAPPPAANKPPTRAYPSEQDKPARRAPEPPPRTATPKPAQAPPAAAAAQEQPAVRKDIPGPVFNTRGRLAAFMSALFAAAVIVGVTFVAGHIATSGAPAVAFQVGVCLLAASGGISLLRSIGPELRLKINSDGILVSRAGFGREISWSQVTRVGISGHGKKMALTVWCAAGTPQPRSTAWHRVRQYDGGVQVFPIGQTGGWWRRRQEAKRIRQALEQYAPHRYDNRLL